ncbi:MAG: hypothetical protein PF448_09095 [Bacteroidales bacterium]|jgi:hypothetical protein|nr:hypothetical protein [Bacteroidales bacterium]
MKLLKTYLLLIILSSPVFATSLMAQQDSLVFENRLRVSTGYMQSNFFRFREPEQSVNIKNGIAREIGFTYSYPMDDKLALGFGLSYLTTTNQAYKYLTKSSLRTSEFSLDFEQTSELVYLPVFLQHNFTDWFAIKMGVSIEIAVASTDYYNQNGLGFFGSTVFHYMPNNRLDIGFEPMVHATAMLPIPQEFYQQHILLFGANAYVAVHF